MLFVDKDQLPSQVALKNLDNALEGTHYRGYTAVLEKQYHPAVCISYEIEDFPTLLVLDANAAVVHRELCVRKMHEDRLRGMLQTIDYLRTFPE